MTVEDWEAAGSTVLLINLKLGLLPLRESLVTGRKGGNEENRVVVPFESTRTRLAKLAGWLIGKRHISRRPQHRLESARQHLRTLPYLRVVCSPARNRPRALSSRPEKQCKQFHYQCSSDQFS